jgi:hypothetical protein
MTAIWSLIGTVGSRRKRPELRDAAEQGEDRKTKLTIAMHPPARPSRPSLRFTRC